MAWHDNRPSVHELNRKIEKGKELVGKGNILTINPGAVAADAAELSFLASELQAVLSKILLEVKPTYYIGRRPPEKSYDPQIKGGDLFTFRWMCREFGCEVYFKFCIKEGCFYLVSLHENR